MGFKEKLQGFVKRHQRLLTFFAICLTILFGLVRPAYCSDDMSGTISEWMPTLMSFIMLSVFVGFMKKMGK